MELKDARSKAIYHYLTENICNSDIVILIELLKDYVYNGSFIDFEENDSRVIDIVDSLYETLGF